MADYVPNPFLWALGRRAEPPKRAAYCPARGLGRSQPLTGRGSFNANYSISRNRAKGFPKVKQSYDTTSKTVWYTWASTRKMMVCKSYRIGEGCGIALVQFDTIRTKAHGLTVFFANKAVGSLIERRLWACN